MVHRADVERWRALHRGLLVVAAAACLAAIAFDVAGLLGGGNAGTVRDVALIALLLLALGVIARRAVHNAAARRETVRALAESQAQMRAILDNAPVAISLKDRAHRYIVLNKQYETWFGVTQAQQLGRTLSHVGTDPAFAALMERIEDRVLAGGVVEANEVREPDIGTAPQWVLTTKFPVKAADGSIIGVGTVNLDITQRRAAEEARRESEARYRLLADHATDVIMLTELGSWKRLYVSPSCRVVLGYAPEDALSLPAADCIHPEDYPAFVAARGRLGPGCVEAASVYRLCRADGRFIWIENRMRYVPPEAGALPRFVSILRDVTANRATEDALRQSEERFRFLVDSVTDYAIFMLDSSGRVRSWNAGAERIKGYAADEIIGGDFGVFHTPDDRSAGEPARSLGTAMRLGTYSREGWRVRKDGSRFWASVVITAVRSPAGELLGFSHLTQDLTLRTIEEEQRKLIAEAAPNGMLMVDGEGTITLANQAVERIFGYPRGALLGTKLEELVPDEMRNPHATSREGFVKAGEGRPMAVGRELVGRRADGSEIPIEVSLSPVDTRHGRMVIVAVNDVTSHRAAEHALHEAKEAAEAADRAKSTFLASVSHEIRTPMNGIIGFADLVLDGKLSAEQRQHMGLLKDAAKSLLAIINDVLDVTKLEAGKVELEALPVRPAEIVEGALSMVRGDASAKGLSLGIAPAAGVPEWIETDPTRLRQILINLLSNAVKFTERGGVTVALSRMSHADGERLRITVTDTGSGIPRERQQRLFQNFSQADRSITRRFGGTGLGLAICKRLAEAMGGAIGCDSEPGKGSTFWFTIALRPAAAPPPAAETGSQGDAPSLQRSVRVLVADDVAMNRLVAGGFLERAGHSIAYVENGAAAVEAVQAQDFDIVLMDMEMPVMGGIAATQAIRALGERVRDIPILALTANAMAEEVARCRAAGMNDHLAKPIDRAELLAAIRKWSGDAVVPEVRRAVESPVVNEAVLDELEAILGRAKLVELTGDLRGRLDAVAQLLGSPVDRERLALEAHALISAAGNLGCMELAGNCRALMIALRQGRREIAPLVAAIVAAAGRAATAIQARYSG